MIAGAVLAALLATATAVAAAAAFSFPDVADHWAFRPVAQLFAAGVVRGTGGAFRPDQPATRAEVVHLLVAVTAAADAARELQGAPSSFADVSSAHWADGAIEAAVERDLVRGFEDGTMRPDRTLTRAELAVLLARALGWTAPGQASTGGGAAPPTFADATRIPAWARDAIAAAAARGWLLGDDQGRFRPADPVSRAEVATVIARVARARGLFDVRGTWSGWNARSRSAAIDGWSWPVAPEAVVLDSAGMADPTAIPAGERVQAVSDAGGRLVYVEVVPQEWVGWLSDRSGPPPRLTVLLPPDGGAPPTPAQPSAPLVPGGPLPEGWTARTVEVAEGAAVFRGGRPEPLAALQPGDRVYLRLDGPSGRARLVDAVAVDLQGRVDAVDVEGRQLAHAGPDGPGFAPPSRPDPRGPDERVAAPVGSPPRTPVAASARIFVDGAPARLADLRPGDRFFASLSTDGEILYLEVRR